MDGELSRPQALIQKLMTRDDYKLRLIDATLRGNPLYLTQTGVYRHIFEGRNDYPGQVNWCHFEYRMPGPERREIICTKKSLTLQDALEIVEQEYDNVPGEFYYTECPHKHR